MFFSDVSPYLFAMLMLPAIINLWGISHAMRRNFPRENERALWVAACIFLPVLGGVLYLIFGLRRSKIIDMNENTIHDIDNKHSENENTENNENNKNNNGESSQ